MANVLDLPEQDNTMGRDGTLATPALSTCDCRRCAPQPWSQESLDEVAEHENALKIPKDANSIQAINRFADLRHLK